MTDLPDWTASGAAPALGTLQGFFGNSAGSHQFGPKAPVVVLAWDMVVITDTAVADATVEVQGTGAGPGGFADVQCAEVGSDSGRQAYPVGVAFGQPPGSQDQFVLVIPTGFAGAVFGHVLYR